MTVNYVATFCTHLPKQTLNIFFDKNEKRHRKERKKYEYYTRCTYSSSELAQVRCLIKYLKKNSYIHVVLFFTSFYCTGASFEQVIHPESLIIFYIDMTTFRGWAKIHIFFSSFVCGSELHTFSIYVFSLSLTLDIHQQPHLLV